MLKHAPHDTAASHSFLMGKPNFRYVAKAEAGRGRRIWDRKAQKWWGEPYVQYPEELLAELNGEKRPEELTDLIRRTERKRR